MPDTSLVKLADDLEVLPPEHPVVEVLAVPRPFGGQRLYGRFAAGLTISEILDRCGIPPGAHARVFVEDTLIPPAWWPYVKPKAGRRVTIRVIPAGGGGGGDDSKVWRTVLLVVILLVAIVTTALTYGALGPVWAAVLGAGIMVAGTLLVNFVLFPIPPPSLARLSGSNLSESPSLAITGARNQANLYGPIPRVYGTYRVFPPYGAQPFTELAGNLQFLRILFIVGTGPLELTDLRIGDTPITQFQGVEVETRPGYPDDAPLSLFPQRVHEESLSILLSNANSWQSRTSPVGVDELSIDVAFPQGLGAISGKGTKFGWNVQIEIQYAPIGTENWVPVTIIDPAAATSSTVYGGFRWTVPRGQYSVRLRRLTPDTIDHPDLLSIFITLGRLELVNALEDTGSVQITDLTIWSALRSFTNEDPVLLPGLAKVTFRIQATEQLHGMIDSFNCLATAILPDWDPPTQTWIPRATGNPAAAYRQVLQGIENDQAVADERLDLASLEAWAEACTGWGFTFNHVVDYETTVFELLRTIAGSARGAFTMLEDRYGVIFERPQLVPIQFFTPRNSRDFKGLKEFPDPVHALKMHFVNPDTGWQQDERIVYDDGYNADGSSGLVPATIFETVDLPGTTDPDQAYKHGRYHLAALRLRPELYEMVTDIENLVCTRGDLVHVSHDVPLWGLGWGRVLAATPGDGGTLRPTVRLDEAFTMEDGKSYSLRIRAADSSSQIATVVTAPGSTKMLSVIAPWVSLPVAGDLAMFGETGRETVPLLVKMITPMADFMARLQLMDAAPTILDADTGPIPPWDSQITLPPLSARFPAIPQIESLRSDESVLIVGGDGTTRNRILITLRAALSGTPFVDFFELRYRVSGLLAWQVLPNISGDATELFIGDVEEGVAYDLRVRAASGNLRSDWRTELNYVVIGKSNPPPDVAGLTLLGSALTWSYPRPPIDLAGFVIRRVSGSVARWEEGLGLHGGLVTATTSFELPPMSGIWTLMVKAEDTVGNPSVNPASLTHDFGDPLLHNIVETRDEHAHGFPGTKEAGTVSVFTGDLEADQVPALLWSSNTSAPLWSNPADLLWSSPYQQLRYTWTYVTGAQAASTTLLVEPGTQGVTTVEYKASASPTWLPFPGAVGGIQPLTSYDFRITIAAGRVQGIIQTLVLYLDAPDLVESFQDLAVAAPGGTRLPLVNTYRTIKRVTATVQAFGSETAITARVQDKNAALGPLIQTLDASGAAVAGHADIDLTGF